VKAERRAFALRLRPNQDLPRRWRPSAGSTEFCARGFTAGSAPPSARISPMAAPSCRLPPSLRSRQAASQPGADGTLQAELDVALVDYLGGIAEGRLMRGDNPVLMTMELVLEVV
jgi:hypothetical protein